MSSSTSSVTRADSGQANYDNAEKGGVAGSKEKGGVEALPVTKDLKTRDTTTFNKTWWLKAPREPYASFDAAPTMPIASANFFSKATFYWMQPMMTTGYQRTLYVPLLPLSSSLC
jgi:ATP-binding cassette subfamily C (CFTR/MRP) protein 1